MERESRGWRGRETHRNDLLKRRINDVLKSNNKPPPHHGQNGWGIISFTKTQPKA
jgi:hypothetical protein